MIISGCKVIGEIQKNKYKYYHCTFSKGRHKEGGEYVREEKLAEMFEDPVRKITLDDDITEWLIAGLKEHSKNVLKRRRTVIIRLKTNMTR